MTKELTCIGCPLGCELTVTLEKDKVTQIDGYSCARGQKYAQKEVTNPTRIVTSTVKVSHGEIAMVSVKTKEDIPKSKVLACSKELRGIMVEAPISIGDVILENICGTGVPVIATKPIMRIN